MRFAGVEKEVVFVPAGDKIGFSKEAAKNWNIPSGVSEIHVRVDAGILVID